MDEENIFVDNKNAFDLATEGNHVRCLNLLNLYKTEKLKGKERGNRSRRRR